MATNLTQKQRLFLSLYLGECHGNATESARRAGYAGNDVTLRQSGHEVLTNPHVAIAIADAHAAIAQQGIANKQNRINAYDARWQRLHAVVEARAEAYATEAPGAATGLLVRTYKQVGQGPSAQLREEWSVDTGLLSEFRQLEQQVAKEMGQWVDKQAPTDPTGEHPYEQLSDEALERRVRGLLDGSRPPPGGV